MDDRLGDPPLGVRARGGQLRASFVSVTDVEIRDATIRLGQLLKLAGVADSGGAVKSLLAAGGVQVNGVPETRRGRQLVRGDRISLGDLELRVT